MTQKQNTLTKTGIVALLACVCCILWGSAIPVIKTGYRLMQVDSADTASQIVFAGVRFTLAGILVLIFASIKERKVMIPDREILKYAVPVCLAQTVGQYFFFYIGVAHTSGVKGAMVIWEMLQQEVWQSYFIWQWSQQWHIHSGLYCLHGMMFRRLQSLDSSIPCAV